MHKHGIDQDKYFAEKAFMSFLFSEKTMTRAFSRQEKYARAFIKRCGQEIICLRMRTAFILTSPT